MGRPTRTPSHGETDDSEPIVAALRRDAQEIFLVGVDAARPREAVLAAIETGPNGGPVIGGHERLAPSSVLLVAFGKAALGMAAAALERIPPAILRPDGIVVVNAENAGELPPFEVFAAGHPLPDETGVRAARRVEDVLATLGKDDAALVLISGGGSALLAAPAADLTLDDKRAVTDLLLAAGADIKEVNAVRKHLSRLKGGGLARAAAPAALEVLILSDVFDDDLSSIASGPTVPDPTTFADATSVLERYGILARVPAGVRQRLAAGQSGEIAETPKDSDPAFQRVRNRIIGSNRISLEAASCRARELGYDVERRDEPLTGEAREAAQEFVEALERAATGGVAGAPRAFLAGGETTVTLRGGGKGGRNQEMALALALAAEHLPGVPPWVFLSGGTDGRDGPTDAAGGLVDADTRRRGEDAGLPARAALDANDSWTFLAASGDLLRTGGTGTNVADLQVLLIGATP